MTTTESAATPLTFDIKLPIPESNQPIVKPGSIFVDGWSSNVFYQVIDVSRAQKTVVLVRLGRIVIPSPLGRDATYVLPNEKHKSSKRIRKRIGLVRKKPWAAIGPGGAELWNGRPKLRREYSD